MSRTLFAPGASIMTTHYGQYEDQKHPIAARIWGHRLNIGQHWMEYMLEFLSVLAGFKYRLGQGLPDHSDQENYLTEYCIPTRLGLRRFVFYDEREKKRDLRDTQAVDELRRHLRRLLPETNGPASDDVLDQVRALLRSFSAVEEDRSWFAKTLFPVHQEFLLWEARRKTDDSKRRRALFDSSDLARLDDAMDFRSRNFFARGGELYYLILSAGTEGRPERRQAICDGLKMLLTQHNKSLGQLAKAIEGAWGELISADAASVSGTVGWILDPGCALYEQIADDLYTFLQNDLDSLECLELLAHLIGFHIISYIYHRAHTISDPARHASGSCLDACRPALLVDLLGDQDGGVVRDYSAGLLREQDDLQLRQARALIMQKLRVWADQEPDDSQLLAHLELQAEQFFQIGQTKTRGKYNQSLGEVRASYTATRLDREGLIESFGNTLYETLSTEFRKNFLGVHRKVGRAIGLIAPRKGPAMRFALGDTLLKTLLMAMVLPGAELSFGEFLERLWLRYGIVVGPGEAYASGLLTRLRINEEFYARNRDALLGRMLRAGLLTQYSDATALVRRR